MAANQGIRRWRKRAGVGLGIVVVVGIGVALFAGSSLLTRYIAYRFETALSDDDRSARAIELLNRGEDGIARLVGYCHGDEPLCTAAAAALDQHLNGMTEASPATAHLCAAILGSVDSTTEAGRSCVLGLLPTIVKKAGGEHAGLCRTWVAAGLTMSSPTDRVRAIQLAMHPLFRMRAEVVPLLDASEPEVRSAALFAVGLATDDDSVIGDEELFRFLHDPDAGVRHVCTSALLSRGRSEIEVARGSRLAHPDPEERLRLLIDLRFEDEVTDPEPWLERLSRDPEAAVRAGAVRVMTELAFARRIATPEWAGRVAEHDANPTVRRVAWYYRLRALSPTPGVRAVGGP